IAVARALGREVHVVYEETAIAGGEHPPCVRDPLRAEVGVADVRRELRTRPVPAGVGYVEPVPGDVAQNPIWVARGIRRADVDCIQILVDPRIRKPRQPAVEVRGVREHARVVRPHPLLRIRGRVLGELVEARVGDHEELDAGRSRGTPGENMQREQGGDGEAPARRTHRPSLRLRIFTLQIRARPDSRPRAESRGAAAPPSVEVEDRDRAGTWWRILDGVAVVALGAVAWSSSNAAALLRSGARLLSRPEQRAAGRLLRRRRRSHNRLEAVAALTDQLGATPSRSAPRASPAPA